MKNIFLITALSISNILFPCEYIKEMIEWRYDEAFKILHHNFDSTKYVKGLENFTDYEMYWYTVGRTECLLELLDDIDGSSHID